MIEELVPAATARSILLRDCFPLGVEHVDLVHADGRILASDLAALRTQPPFPASAMDGYAVRQADIRHLPVSLVLLGASVAGRGYRGTVEPGKAVRIFTGAPVPEGADTIIIQENTEADDQEVRVLSGETPGRYIRPAGLDFKTGDILLREGMRIDPPRLALAASMNHPQLPVWRKPKLALMATGDELVPPGSRLAADQIIASNNVALAAIARSAGADVIDMGIVEDDMDRFKAAIGHALEGGADVVVTTGGASVGDHDLARPAFEAMGTVFEFSRIAMRPGKPLLYGTMRRNGMPVHVLCLAGNPVSSIIAGMVFLRPLLEKLGGGESGEIAITEAVLGCDLPENDEREEYMRATLSRLPDGRLEATPFPRQDSSMLAILAGAEALVIREANAPPAHKGDRCRITRIRGAGNRRL